MTFYKLKEVALISKCPTPVQIERTRGHRVLSGVMKGKSTVDYDGVYKGFPVTFGAKSFKGKSFPLKNIKDHQIQYLLDSKKHGGKAFLLIHSADTDNVFLVMVDMMEY